VDCGKLEDVVTVFLRKTVDWLKTQLRSVLELMFEKEDQDNLSCNFTEKDHLQLETNHSYHFSKSLSAVLPWTRSSIWGYVSLARFQLGDWRDLLLEISVSNSITP